MDERKPQTGDRRFACQCGGHFFDGNVAMAHTLMGHETVLERYSNGDWRYHPQPIAEYLVEMLEPRLGGEGMEDYVLRLEKMAANAEHETARMTRNNN